MEGEEGITFYCWWCFTALDWREDREQLWCPTCKKPRGPNDEPPHRPPHAAQKGKGIDMTLCVECTHFLCQGPHWYDHFCGASPREQGIDPVTGEEGYVDHNDLGRRYITDEPYRYARDINTDGNCALFVPKQ